MRKINEKRVREKLMKERIQALWNMIMVFGYAQTMKLCFLQNLVPSLHDIFTPTK